MFYRVNLFPKHLLMQNKDTDYSVVLLLVLVELDNNNRNKGNYHHHNHLRAIGNKLILIDWHNTHTHTEQILKPNHKEGNWSNETAEKVFGSSQRIFQFFWFFSSWSWITNRFHFIKTFWFWILTVEDDKGASLTLGFFFVFGCRN